MYNDLKNVSDTNNIDLIQQKESCTDSNSDLDLFSEDKELKEERRDKLGIRKIMKIMKI